MPITRPTGSAGCGERPAAPNPSTRAVRPDSRPRSQIRRVVICTGKVYFDLLEEREKRGIDDVYLLRVEQLYPFPAKSLAAELARFKKADVVWCQEEPKNMGAWAFVQPYLDWAIEQLGRTGQRPRYIGRPASASTATGLMRLHLQQLGRRPRADVPVVRVLLTGAAGFIGGAVAGALAATDDEVVAAA